MTIPALVLEATTDPELHAKDLHVLLQLFTLLDVSQYRRAKQSLLEFRLGISQPEACRALARLRDRGYIEEGPREGSCKTYRMALSPFPSTGRAA